MAKSERKKIVFALTYLSLIATLTLLVQVLIYSNGSFTFTCGG